MTQRIVTLDVRQDIREGREPFSRIIQTAEGLQIQDTLLLIAPFEPVPLYRILARQGFSYQSKPTETGDWEVLFLRRTAPDHSANLPSAARPEAVSCGCNTFSTSEVDARGLEPPQPLVTILEALATLPNGAQLRAHTDRRPVHLYTHLEERGFIGDTQPQADGSFITCIRRRSL